ncbi:hypothetical protein JR311_19740 (plasmid) [Bacillus velezensis]|uniref:hypothetical protein n=1 Tax=Bacillus velezensis TaxID=492670 RepID=UPI001956C21A|nr:hypothetical protein [Bacillus velezensis]QRV11415.1 hypothetical protein JR311_20555 [Bacillus velezensis]QRV11443.1 hypothetical protein JR311_19740 [Bacillus velezensis]
MKTTNVFSYSGLARNVRIVVNSQWVCINGKNAGRIAQVKSEPVRGLYWLDSDVSVNYIEGDLFVNKQN